MALTKRKKRKIGRIILCIFSLLLLAALIWIMPLYTRAEELHKQAKALVASSTRSTFQSTQTTVVYDCNGDELCTMRAAKDLYYVSLSQVPQTLQDSFIVMEDKKFYSHPGIDFGGIVRALVANQQSGEIEQGASTITQQLARNIFLTQDVTWGRKIEEMFVALELEKRYSKSDILEFYLNNIYFANGYYGIEAAAKGYFHCSVGELSIAQMAFIAAIPNSPNKYDPVAHFDATLERRNLIIRQLYDAGKINTMQYNSALAEEMILQPVERTKNNYVETYVRRCATESMMTSFGFVFLCDFATEEAYNTYCEQYDAYYAMCQQKLFGGGYSIYTSINPKMQEQLQQTVDYNLSGSTAVNEEGVYALQAASTCIDNATGNVVAIVGGRTQNEITGYTLNRAYQSYRQPGSSIKPLSVYTPCLQVGYTPDSVVSDDEIEGGPVNADGTYDGLMPLRHAVAVSKNTVAWKLYEQLTPQVCSSFLMRMGFRKVYMDKNSQAASLGGFTYGVTTEEMAGGFAAIENDGVFRTPTCIVRIQNASGAVVADTSKRAVKIYEVNASRMMTDMLRSVVTEGTGSAANITNAIVAGKTGTTNSNKDSWFVGYSRYYTTSVWVGYDMPRTLGSYVNYNKIIFNQFMQELHEGLPLLPFARYTDKNGSDATAESTTEMISSTQASTDATAGTQPTTQPTTMNPYREHDATGVDHYGDQNATNITGQQSTIQQPFTQQSTTQQTGTQQSTTQQAGIQQTGTTSESRSAVMPTGRSDNLLP